MFDAKGNPQPKPCRLKLSRKRGFDLQAFSLAWNGRPCINCARPGRFGNPHHHHSNGKAMTGSEANQALCARYSGTCVFTNAKRKKISVEVIRTELQGKNLACFCGVESKFCHVNVLLKIANRPAE